MAASSRVGSGASHRATCRHGSQLLGLLFIIRSPSRRSKAVGHHNGDERSQGRKTSGDDADVCFDGGESGCGRVVVGRICGIGDSDKGLEADDGNDTNAVQN